MTIHLACVPPTTTSQKKRASMRGGRLRFFKSAALEAAERTYAALLLPFRPPAPLTGPVSLRICFTWPHLAKTAQKDRARRVPKMTRPDADNLVKQLQDTITRLRFIEDDGQIARLELEKWHGPDVGIAIDLAPFPAEAR